MKLNLSIIIVTCLLLTACQSTLTPTAEDILETQAIVQPNVYAKGFAWFDGTTLPLAYQFNQRFDYVGLPPTRVSYPTADNTVTHLGTGRYLVRFPNLNVQGGIVHVTAYGGSHHCKVEQWRPAAVSVRELQVFVRCRNAANVLADGKFTVLFYKNGLMSDIYALSYLLSDNLGTAIHHYNSRGGLNTIRRLGVGAYEVKLGRMERRFPEADKGGTVLVTAYGPGAQRCKTVRWGFTGSDIVVRVNCFTGGTPSDSGFSLSFLRDPGTLAISVAEDKKEAWYVWANTTPTPNHFYQSNSYGDPTDAGSPFKATLSPFAGSGHYRVTLPGVKAFNKTTTQLTAYGSDSAYCNIVGWFPSLTPGATDVEVRCYNASGVAANAQFDLFYYTDETIFF
jgi:hypothetical protein